MKLETTEHPLDPVAVLIAEEVTNYHCHAEGNQEEAEVKNFNLNEREEPVKALSISAEILQALSQGAREAWSSRLVKRIALMGAIAGMVGALTVAK